MTSMLDMEVMLLSKKLLSYALLLGLLATSPLQNTSAKDIEGEGIFALTIPMALAVAGVIVAAAFHKPEVNREIKSSTESSRLLAENCVEQESLKTTLQDSPDIFRHRSPPCNHSPQP